MTKISTATTSHYPSAWRLNKTVALIGLMGSGKSSIGKRLSAVLGTRFRDADAEIEKASNLTIPEFFEKHGEPEFRKGERRVISRLVKYKPHILATGGGAYMNADTRKLLQQKAFTIWLRADLETLLERTGRKDNRPLLNQGNPEEVLRNLIEIRHPVYEEADSIIDSGNQTHDELINKLINALSSAHIITAR